MCHLKIETRVAFFKGIIFVVALITTLFVIAVKADQRLTSAQQRVGEGPGLTFKHVATACSV